MNIKQEFVWLQEINDKGAFSWGEVADLYKLIVRVMSL